MRLRLPPKFFRLGVRRSQAGLDGLVYYRELVRLLAIEHDKLVRDFSSAACASARPCFNLPIFAELDGEVEQRAENPMSKRFRWKPPQ